MRDLQAITAPWIHFPALSNISETALVIHLSLDLSCPCKVNCRLPGNMISCSLNRSLQLCFISALNKGKTRCLIAERVIWLPGCLC